MAWLDMLQKLGLPSASGWLGGGDVSLDQRIASIRQAGSLVLFRTSGDPVGIEMLEVGIAIGAGRPVVLAGDSPPAVDHPAVRVRAGVGMEAAIREAHELSLAVRAPSS